jgi:hypothetical protein
MPLTINDLQWHIDTAIKDNHFLGILITSEAQGVLESEGWGYGAGKTTTALNLAKYRIFNEDFNRVKEHLIGFAYQLQPFLINPNPTPCVIWDDMQVDVGKNKAHDQDVMDLAYQLTIERTHLRVLIGTVPHRGMLQKDFREEIFHIEVIVPKRGVIEIQKLKRWIPFHRPLNIEEKFVPLGNTVMFDLLPEEQTWYDEWREWRNKEARKRVGLLQNPNEKPTFKRYTATEFSDLARDLGLKGDQALYHKLWKETVAQSQQVLP